MAAAVLSVDPRLYRATWDNRVVEDLSAHVISATVTCDPDRDTTWVLDARITREGWLKLRPYYDWVAPYLTVRYANGTTKTAQLGLYLVLDSGEAHEEHHYTVKLDARDPLWLLGAQGFTGPLVVQAGTDRMRAAKAVIDGAVLTGGDDLSVPKRYAIPDSGRSFRRRREWPRTTNRLELVNEIVTSCSFYPVWTTETGVITTRKRGTSRLRDRGAARIWVANVPANEPDPDFASRRLLPGEVTGAVNTSPRSADMVNEILIVNDDPHLPRVNVKGRVRSGVQNPRVIFGSEGDRGGKKVRKIRHPLVDEDASAQELADALMDELGTRNSTVSLAVLPDPIPLVREVVKLGIWNARGERVAYGKYLVHRVQYGFTPEDATMKLDLGRVVDED